MNWNIIFMLSVFTLFVGCSTEEELSFPDTIKGMKLGLDPDEQLSIGLKNGICENDFGTTEIIRYNFDPGSSSLVRFTDSDSPCQYRLDEDIVVRPILNYGFLNGEKILSDITLLFHSPSIYSFVTINDGSGRAEIGRPTVTWDQVENIISLYDKKYGKGTGGNIRQWISGDLCITLRVSEYFDIEEKGACSCIVRYQYIEEKRKQISFNDPENAPI